MHHLKLTNKLTLQMNSILQHLSLDIHRDKIIHKRWSFDFSWFHWLDRFSLRVVSFFFLDPLLLKAVFCPSQDGGCSYAVSFWVAILAFLFNTFSSLLLTKKKKESETLNPKLHHLSFRPQFWLSSLLPAIYNQKNKIRGTMSVADGL